MKLLVKTLKGGKFEIQVEETNTLAEVKGIIESTKAELPAATLKLIHSGKVLKDEDTIGSCSVKENDFLVVMVTKPKKVAVVAAPAAAAPTPPTPAAAAAADTKTPAPSATETTAPAAPARDEFPSGALENLVAMGFPEAEVRHCLRAASGNPDMAVEFLTNGIPDGVQQAAAVATGTSPAAAAAAGAGSGGSGPTLQGLRNHPQFDDLRRLVQSNPQMLQQVLTQIGQQQPDLLAEINANQPLFLQMMNEPVGAAAPAGGSPVAPRGAGAGAMPAGMMEGMGNPAQMAQMIQGMGPEELEQMAAMMGLSPDQLRTTAQMIGQMPPEQLSQFMMQAMGGDGTAGGAGGGAPGGGQVLHLTEEEMAAVDRLTEMGFDRSEAAQAFLACDKNEALAANLLMDGGFGFGADDAGASGSGGGGGGSGNNGNGGGDNNDDDAMYD